jgi:hypothetical protein
VLSDLDWSQLEWLAFELLGLVLTALQMAGRPGKLKVEAEGPLAILVHTSKGSWWRQTAAFPASPRPVASGLLDSEMGELASLLPESPLADSSGSRVGERQGVGHTDSDGGKLYCL